MPTPNEEAAIGFADAITRDGRSGLTLASRTAHVWTLLDGRLRRNQLYRQPEHALRELGI